MSLFKAREWWSTTCGSDETFDASSLLVAPIGPTSQSAQRIVVASHQFLLKVRPWQECFCYWRQGFVRVYQPSYEDRGDGEEAAENGFRPDDLLLELQLDQPVLHLLAGHFVSSSTDTCLALLLPFQVTVYTMTMSSGTVEHGTHYTLSPVYSHRLNRSAFNMFAGAFGGAKTKELFCVQSLDGTLSFFEQENFAFSRFLPGYLIPGPILFVQKTDSVVTATSSWTIDAYKYPALAQGADASEKLANDKGSGKRVYADWSYNVGEASLDIQQVTLTSGEVQLVVLAEHSLLVLKDSGQLVLFKRLDYHPACLVTFLNDAGRLTALVASHTCVGHVYEGGVLRWAARLPFAASAASRVQLGRLAGLLVLLSPAGALTAAYLGTTPSLFVAPPVQAAGALDYRALDAELASLNRVIHKSQAQTDSNLVPKSKAGHREVKLIVQIHPVLDPCSLPSDVDQQVPCASIRALLSSAVPVSSVLVSFHVTSPLTVVKPSAAIESLTSTTDVEAVVYLERAHAIPSLELETVVSYLAAGGAPRVLRATARLPLSLVARQADPVKDAEHRITICTARPSVDLAHLFSDLSLDSNMSSAAGIEYYTGCNVTILASKTSQRYRLQSDDLHALWLIIDEFVRRIGALYDETPGEPICSYASSLPLQDLFAEMDAHLLWRQRRQQQLQQLEQRASQFRAIQRRLLTKYKDVTPSPLTNMDQLLEETYRRLLSQAEQVSDDQRRLDRCSAQLSCAVQLVLLLARLSQTLGEADISLLSAALSWRCDESHEQGWHETVDVAASYLYKTLQQADGRVEVGSAALVMPPDTDKLKRHVGLLLDKVVKAGAKIGDSVNRTDLPAEPPGADECPRPPSVQPLSQMFSQRLGSARPRSGARPASGAVSRPVKTPSVEVEPPTPLLRRPRRASSDSVDAEATDSLGGTTRADVEPRAEADGSADVQRLIPHSFTSGGVEAPHENLLDEPEEDFW